MMERYKILGAMVALREFTADQVAELAGVKRASVHTVLRRNEPWIERGGQQATGKRGGQPVRYRLRPDAVEQVRAILKGVEEAGRHREPSDGPPVELVDAESILLDRIPEEPDPAMRAVLLDSARDLVTAGRHEAQRSAVGNAHLVGASLLLLLAETEHFSAEADAAWRVWQLVSYGTRDLVIPGDERLGDEIRTRVATSPLADARSRRHTPMPLVTAMPLAASVAPAGVLTANTTLGQLAAIGERFETWGAATERHVTIDVGSTRTTISVEARHGLNAKSSTDVAVPMSIDKSLYRTLRAAGAPSRVSG